MEEVLRALNSIKNELNEQRLEIRATGKNVTEKVTENINKMLEEKFLVWEEKHENLRKVVENQEKRIYFLEKQERKRNLVIFGIEETETSYENLERNIINWADQYFSIKLNYSDIQEVKRIGKKGVRPRPTIVSFTTLGIKINILKNRYALKNTSYNVKEDYPKYVLEKRKELQEQVQLEREKGNKAIIKYDKLIILSKNNPKRKLLSSPQNVTTPNAEEITPINKKNKLRKSDALVQRSNSITEGIMKPSMLNFLINKNATNSACSQDKQ
ncbi:uncharacterized protein LOC128198868 [Bicyclus anynana]|uniref:Uncharacterized protein LOC128198868 n=1 Tax=Bicyclus anynana TaxID=110368 RepID=A0ABM3LT83_BICAN|nr:uncharacterized protein LOC128198868 [Bicyclus anynana]